MLDDGRDPGVAQPLRVRACVGHHLVGIGGEGSIADHRVVRLTADVDDGGVVDGHTQILQPASPLERQLVGLVDGHRLRCLPRRGDLSEQIRDAGYAAALLVDGDHRRHRRGVDDLRDLSVRQRRGVGPTPDEDAADLLAGHDVDRVGRPGDADGE